MRNYRRPRVTSYAGAWRDIVCHVAVGAQSRLAEAAWEAGSMRFIGRVRSGQERQASPAGQTPAPLPGRGQASTPGGRRHRSLRHPLWSSAGGVGEDTTTVPRSIAVKRQVHGTVPAPRQRLAMPAPSTRGALGQLTEDGASELWSPMLRGGPEACPRRPRGIASGGLARLAWNGGQLPAPNHLEMAMP